MSEQATAAPDADALDSVFGPIDADAVIVAARPSPPYTALAGVGAVTARALGIPTTPAAMLAESFAALLAYEAAQDDAGAAADAYYRHEEAGDTIEAAAVARLIGRGIAATPAAKAAKTEPDVLAWAEAKVPLAQRKAETERTLGKARRRHTTLLAALSAFAALPTLATEFAALCDPSNPDSDGR